MDQSSVIEINRLITEIDTLTNEHTSFLNSHLDALKGILANLNNVDNNVNKLQELIATKNKLNAETSNNFEKLITDVTNGKDLTEAQKQDVQEISRVQNINAELQEKIRKNDKEKHEFDELIQHFLTTFNEDLSAILEISKLNKIKADEIDKIIENITSNINDMLEDNTLVVGGFRKRRTNKKMHSKRKKHSKKKKLSKKKLQKKRNVRRTKRVYRRNKKHSKST